MNYELCGLQIYIATLMSAQTGIASYKQSVVEYFGFAK